MKNRKKEINKGKIGTYVSVILFMAVVIVIYMVSPRITVNIQNAAKWIYEIDENYITRVVELILSITLLLAGFSTYLKINDRRGE